MCRRTIGLILSSLLCALVGCKTYEGGKVIDGTNLEIGLSVPGTEHTWTINALAYTSGLKVCGDRKTAIIVTNEVAETNSYLWVVKTCRHTKMSSIIEPAYWTIYPTNEVSAIVITPNTEQKPIKKADDD